MPASDHAAVRLWRALFADGDAVGAGRELVLFFLGPPADGGGAPSRRASWHADLDSALAAARRGEEAGEACYFHLALHDRAAAVAAAARRDAERGRGGERPLHRVRGDEESARVLGAAWVDCDLRGPRHPKPQLPETLREILEPLQAAPLRPSAHVVTGSGGVHAYWILSEPWELETPAERELAHRTTRGWTNWLRERGGLVPDPGHDLARVLRVPGLRDPAAGREVVLAALNDLRYHVDDFEPFLVDPEGRAAVRAVQAGGLVLHPDAQPPWPKLLWLVQNDARFAATWNRQRRDFKKEGLTQSQSAYDLSLAAQLVALEWSDQEVVDTLIYHRREGGGKEKLRPDYYALTLGKCRRDRAAEVALEQLEAQQVGVPVAAPPAPAAAVPSAPEGTASEAPGAPSGPPPRAAPPPTPDQREQNLASLRELLGLDLRAVIKHPIDGGSVYCLVVGPTRHTLGSIETIITAGAFRARVADITGRLIPAYKPPKWAPIAQALLRLAEVEDLGSESDPAQHVADLVASYLSTMLSRARVGGLTQGLPAGGSVLGRRAPFVGPDLRAHLYLDEFSDWVRKRLGNELGPKSLGRMLRSAGITPKTLSVTTEAGARTSTHCWVVPRDVWSAEEAEAALAGWEQGRE